MLFVKILVIDAVVIAGYGILAKVFGWNETVLLILLVIIAVFTGCYYQWQKQKIERQG